MPLVEAATRLGITIRVARKAAANGDLPAIRFRKRFLVLRREFEQMLVRDTHDPETEDLVRSQ